VAYALCVGQVITLVYGTWLRKLTFLRGCETTCVMTIALAFKPVTFAPTESPKLRHLYVIVRGLVTYGLRCVVAPPPALYPSRTTRAASTDTT
jgi:hypothetical protein